MLFLIVSTTVWGAVFSNCLSGEAFRGGGGRGTGAAIPATYACITRLLATQGCLDGFRGGTVDEENLAHLSTAIPN